MKISRLHINQYKHLENISFDFTYRDGDRKGKPLEKICLIGQSATGKTTLLDLIYQTYSQVNNTEIINGNSLFHLPTAKNFQGDVAFIVNGIPLLKSNNELIFNSKSYKEDLSGGGSVTNLISKADKKNILYFKANLISDKNIEFFTKNPIELVEKYNSEIQQIIQNRYYENQSEITFDEEVKIDIWIMLLYEILEYRKNFTQKVSELIHKGLIADQKKLTAEFKKWQSTNPNVLEEFAEKFNPILKKLQLEVDLVNTEFIVPIKNIQNDEVISFQYTSTGTKGLLLSFLPIFKSDTTDSIIMIDEPERSLYPDIQMDLIDHYKNIAPNAQLIVATHSPFIAAAFEPDERFVLQFDDRGKILVKRGNSPIGDDPNDILKNDFDINYINKYGQQAYRDYLKLKEKLTNELNPEEKKKLLLETVKLGDTYKF